MSAAAGLATNGIAELVAGLDWRQLEADLDIYGCAVAKAVLSSGECRSLADKYDDGELFRSRIVMARHGFGRGEYQYFRYPLPETVAELRAALYPPLSRVATRWNQV